MEISDYLRVIKQRIRVLVVLPLTAVVLVVAVQLIRPQGYKATATVAVPAVIAGDDSQYSGPSATRAFVSDLVAMIESPTIAARVEEATGTPAARVLDGISAGTVGDGGSLVEVTYRSRYRDEVEPVASAAAGEAIAFLFEASAEIAQQRVEAAEQAIEEAQDQIDAFTFRTDLLIPDLDFDAKVSALSSLELAQIEAKAAGQFSRASSIGSAIDDLREELSELAPQVQEYAPLATRRSEAAAQFEAATHELGQARANIAAGKSGTVVTASVVRPIPRIQDIARKGAAALGAGLFAAAALAIWLDLTNRRLPGETAPTSARRIFAGWRRREKHALVPADQPASTAGTAADPTVDDPQSCTVQS